MYVHSLIYHIRFARFIDIACGPIHSHVAIDSHTCVIGTLEAHLCVTLVKVTIEHMVS